MDMEKRDVPLGDVALSATVIERPYRCAIDE
jgi:hypothetical protein